MCGPGSGAFTVREKFNSSPRPFRNLAIWAGPTLTTQATCEAAFVRANFAVGYRFGYCTDDVTVMARGIWHPTGGPGGWCQPPFVMSAVHDDPTIILAYSSVQAGSGYETFVSQKGSAGITTFW